MSLSIIVDTESQNLSILSAVICGHRDKRTFTFVRYCGVSQIGRLGPLKKPNV